MNFIADHGPGKWPFGSIWRAGAVMVTAAGAFGLSVMAAEPAWAAHKPTSILSDLFAPRGRPRARLQAIPLPQPRPAQAPAAVPAEAAAPAETPAASRPALPGPAAPEAPASTAAATPPPPSACRQALTEEVAIAPSIADIHDPGGCGGEDLVRLEAIVLPDKHRVPLSPPATLRCHMASEIADWVRTDIAGIAAGIGSEPAGLDNFDSYECRGFNRIAGAHLSEHGRANALDVRSVKLANGQTLGLTDRTVSREVREAVLHSVCARFMTVLGPGSDGYHEDHIHLDLMERRNNYKICQWNVLDPLPQVAPLLPAARPEEAPPREKAEGEK